MSLLNCFLSSTCTCVTNRTCRGLQLMLSFSITVAQSSACLYLHSTICLCIFLSRLFNLGVLNVCQKCLAISSGCCRRFHIGMVYKKYAIVSSSSSWCAIWGCILQLLYLPHCTSNPLMSLTSHHNSTTSLASPSSTSKNLTLFVVTIGEKIIDIDDVGGCKWRRTFDDSRS